MLFVSKSHKRQNKTTTSTRRPQKEGLANKDVNILPTAIVTPVQQDNKHVDNGRCYMCFDIFYFEFG